MRTELSIRRFKTLNGFDTVETDKALSNHDVALPELESVRLAPDEHHDWQLEGYHVKTVTGEEGGMAMIEKALRQELAGYEPGLFMNLNFCRGRSVADGRKDTVTEPGAVATGCRHSVTRSTHSVFANLSS